MIDSNDTIEAEIETVDVLIVGSGPTGTSIALHLVQRNPDWANRILLVDKAVHPREKLCGGGITHMGQNILADLGLTLQPTHFDVREVKLIYDDQSYSFLGDPVFRIVRRSEFDHWLVQECEQRGVTISQGEAVKEIAVAQTHVVVTTDQRTIHAQMIIAADGSKSFVRSKLKWNDHGNDGLRVARLVEVDTPEDPAVTPEFRDAVAVFDFSRMVDGHLQGYYWDFPSYVDGEPIMNRGLFDSRAQPKRPKAKLKELLRGELATRGRDLDDYKLKGAPIRWFDKNAEIARPRVLLAGDAAGVDPLMGEGISFALGYGPVVAETIEDAFRRHDFSFDSYRPRLMKTGLFRQLQMRVQVARFAYILKYPRFFRAGWAVANRAIKLTRWRNPNYTPSQLPVLK